MLQWSHSRIDRQDRKPGEEEFGMSRSGSWRRADERPDGASCASGSRRSRTCSIAAGLMSWDQQTMMPSPRRARSRRSARDAAARQPRAVHLRRRRASCCRPPAESLDGADPDGDDARLVSVVARRLGKATRVPAELAAELARTSAIGATRHGSPPAAPTTSPPSPRTWSATSRSRGSTSTASTPSTAPTTSLLDDYEPGMKIRGGETACLPRCARRSCRSSRPSARSRSTRVSSTAISRSAPSGSWCAGSSS